MSVAIHRPAGAFSTPIPSADGKSSTDAPSSVKTGTVSQDFFSQRRLKNLFASPQAYVPRAFYKIHRGAAEGGSLTEYLYAHGDISGVVSQTEDVWMAMEQNAYQQPVGYNLGRSVNGLFGMTSVSSIVTGTITGTTGHHQFSQASRIGDGVGVFAGFATVFRGILEACSGGVTTASRIAMFIPSVTATTLTGLMIAGSAGFTAVYVAACATFSMTAHDIRQFWTHLDEAVSQGTQKGYAFLIEALSPSSQEVEAALSKVQKTPSFALQHQDEDDLLRGYRSFRSGTLHTSGVKKHVIEQFEAMRNIVSEKTWEQLEETVLAKSDPKQRQANLANALNELMKSCERRITKVGRAVGSTVVERLLRHGKTAPAAVQKQLVDHALTKTHKHFWTYALLAGVFAFGATALIASIVCTGGIPHIVATIALLATGLATTAIDGYFLYEALQNNQPKQWENIAMWAFSVAFLGAAIAATLLSGGLAPALVVGAVSVCWLTLFIITQSTWSRPHDEKHRYDDDVRLGAPAIGV